MYREKLGGIEGLRCVLPERQGRHVFYRFVIRYPKAEAIEKALAAKGIETCRPFFTAAHREPAPPVAIAAEADTLFLPIGSAMTAETVATVCEAIRAAI